MNNKTRNKFPFLKRMYPTSLKLRGTDKGRSLAYLDSASTTQKPQVVIDAISDVYKNHYANIHRGVYDLSQEATEAYEKVREKVAKFINAEDSSEVIFTRNTTEGINLVARLLGDWMTWKDGDEILLSEMEHHSNIVPWQMLRERLGIRGQRLAIKYLPIDDEGKLRMDLLPKYLSKNTKIVSLTLMSNVLGTINPIREIVDRVKGLGSRAIIIVDAAQAVGHMRVDVDALGCDFLAFSAHKMYGPTGVGVLWGKKKQLDELPPFMGGGDMILSVGFEKTTFNEVPWKFEAGTPNIADVVAFGEAINFVEKTGFEQIYKLEMKLTKLVLRQLMLEQNVEIYGGLGTEERGPVIPFNVSSVHPHDVASILSREAVAIRSGHHCAQPLMNVLGAGAVCRVSFGVYNTEEEVIRFINGINKVKEVFDLPVLPVSNYQPLSEV